MLEDVLIGCAYLVIVLLCLPIQLLLFRVFLKKENFKKLTAIKIMIQIGLLECAHLIFGSLFAGLMTICRTQFHLYFHRMGGAVVTACWFGMTAFSLLLSVNRFLVFVGVKMSKSVESAFYNVFSLMSWLLVAVMIAAHMIPELSVYYSLRFNVYVFSRSTMCVVVEKVEFQVITATLILIFVIYLATVIAIIVQRSGYTQKVKVSAGETRLLFTAIVSFVYLALIRAGWHFTSNWKLTPIQISFVGLFGDTVGGLNPALYLIFNKPVRRHFLVILRLRQESTAVINITPAATAAPGNTRTN